TLPVRHTHLIDFLIALSHLLCERGIAFDHGRDRLGNTLFDRGTHRQNFFLERFDLTQKMLGHTQTSFQRTRLRYCVPQSAPPVWRGCCALLIAPAKLAGDNQTYAVAVRMRALARTSTEPKSPVI